MWAKDLSLSREQTEKFWARVRLGTGCWEWVGYRQPNQYGVFTLKHPVRAFAHRISWALSSGPIPDGMCVLHHCDNPPCVRPDHLFLGTHTDNSADKTRKGRTVCGDRHWSRTMPWRLSRGEQHYARKSPERVVRGEKRAFAKLNAESVRDIRSSQATLKQLAAQYGVSFQTISKIRSGRSWKHIA